MVSVKILGDGAAAVSGALDMLLGHDLSPAPTAGTDLLILMPNADTSKITPCRILLLPDEPITIPPCSAAVSYGMSGRCTVTLSSIGKRSSLAIQRCLPTLYGGILEPQEIPVRNCFSLSDYELMASSAAALILGASADTLS